MKFRDLGRETALHRADLLIKGAASIRHGDGHLNLVAERLSIQIDHAADQIV